MGDESKTKAQLISELRGLKAKAKEMVIKNNNQHMEAIGIFAAGIAHEFNNVMGAIIGYAEIMEIFDQTNDEEIKSRIKGILRSAYKAKDLVKQIQSLGRRTEEQMAPVHMDLIVKESLKFQNSFFPETIKVEKKLYYKEVAVAAAPLQIHQILIHLFKNAIDAMGADGGVLTVALEELKIDGTAIQDFPNLLPGSYALLTVADTGEGIDGETQKKIFDPYFTTRKKDEKAGLGLTIIDGIVKELNGHIEVDAKPGEGCAVKIIIPVVKNEAFEPDEAGDVDLPMGCETILFVDDERDLVEIGEKILGRLGYKVTVKRSGAQAFDLFQMNPEIFDLVITDMIMPGMTGLDLTEKILNIRPQMPIILCTGYKGVVSPEAARNSGIREIILKPITVEKLAVSVRRVLDEEI